MANETPDPFAALHAKALALRAKNPKAKSNGERTAGGEPVFPIIQVSAGQSHVAETRATQLLIETEGAFFQRSGMLVSPREGSFKLRSEVPDGNGGFVRKHVNYPATYCTKADVPMMHKALEKIAVWQKYDMRSHDWFRCKPDRDAVSMIVSGGGVGFPVLSSITTVPFILWDGSIIRKHGYHADPGIYLALDEGLAVPDIPEDVPFELAEKSAKLLEGLLAEFPFVGSVDLAVAMSALITPIARKALDIAPLHAITAPEIGTGKSYLTDIASAIRLGSPMPSQGARDEVAGELDKGLTAALLRDAAMLSVDNVTSVLYSPLLAQIIERERVVVRVLGESRDVELGNSICLFASGNNLRVKGDLVRRVLLCQLDRGVERPYEHAFASEPVRMVLRDRGRYIAAALTLARYGLRQPRLEGIRRFNSFDDWTRAVREPLIRLGYADPADGQRASEMDDPASDLLARLISKWHELLGGTPTPIAALVKEEALREVLSEAAPDGHGGISANRLGGYLGRNKGKVSDGKLIARLTKDADQRMRWCIKATRR